MSCDHCSYQCIRQQWLQCHVKHSFVFPEDALAIDPLTIKNELKMESTEELKTQFTGELKMEFTGELKMEFTEELKTELTEAPEDPASSEVQEALSTPSTSTSTGGKSTYSSWSEYRTLLLRWVHKSCNMSISDRLLYKSSPLRCPF